MKSIGDILSHKPEKGRAVCRACGAEVRFSVNQYQRLCPACGIAIKLTRQQVLTERDTRGQVQQTPPRCWLCGDKGFLLYEAQEGNLIYEYGARCYCAAGMAKKEISGWPRVDQVPNICDLKFLAQKRRDEWERKFGKIEKSPDPALMFEGEEIPF